MEKKEKKQKQQNIEVSKIFDFGNLNIVHIVKNRLSFNTRVKFAKTTLQFEAYYQHQSSLTVQSFEGDKYNFLGMYSE